MPETPESADEIRTIRYRIESIETTQHLLLRERAPQLRNELLALFRATDKLQDVYFAINGNRTQGEIVEYLKRSAITISQPTVSRRMALLEEEGLIQKVGAKGAGIVFAKKEVVEKVLRLSQHLSKQQSG